MSGEHSECTEKYMSTRIHDKTENQFAHREGYTKLMIIGTKDDIIVPLELIHDNFAQYEIMEQGGHALGFKEPEAIYQKIIEFTNDS